jgi:hypothetical protein
MRNLGKNAGNRKHTIIFFPLSPNFISMRGKKYHKKGAQCLKRRKRKKRQGKGKEKWQNDRARTMFHKIMGNLGNNAGIRGQNTIFFPQMPKYF